MFDLLVPDWPAPEWVRSVVTTRAGGVSKMPYESLNLGLHVHDAEINVQENRSLLRQHLPDEPEWLEQVHSDICLDVDHSQDRVGDAAITRQNQRVVGVLVADCLPILVAACDAQEVAAIHAGWRGLAGGVIRKSIQAFRSRDLVAWMGPAIGPCHYEVGRDVRSQFDHESAFTEEGGKWLMDLYGIAKSELLDSGVREVWGGGFCTHCDERFYSYRKEGTTGRQGAFIWLSA